jgi:hypothetical protein
MSTRHSGLIFLLGALLGVLSGSLFYAWNGRLLPALGAALVPLLLCAWYGNRARARRDHEPLTH